jgi:hypothetical protein
MGKKDLHNRLPLLSVLHCFFTNACQPISLLKYGQQYVAVKFRASKPGHLQFYDGDRGFLYSEALPLPYAQHEHLTS